MADHGAGDAPARPAWLFDEFSGHRWLDADEVAAYEENNRTDPSAERELLRTLGLSAGDTLIDFGSGNGALAIEAARLCRRVIAVDPSAAMIDYARTKAIAEGATNIDFVQQGFLTYVHAGDPPDIAVTRHALHLLPDFWKVEALRRVFRVLRPGGTFHLRELAYSFEPDDAARAIAAWIGSVPVAAETGFSRDFFEEHVREKYATYAWLLEAMLRKVGFAIESATYSDDQSHARYLCLKPPV